MDNGLVDIGPQLDTDVAIGDLDIAFVEVQDLPERLHVESGRQTDTETSQLQQTVVLVETATARQVEQHIAMLHPHIHAHIATTTGHRL